MSPENFAYWLQGYFEIGKSEELTKEQVQEIKNHLKLVLLKLTPSVTIQPESVKIDSKFWGDIRKQVDNTPVKPFTITC